MYTDMPIVDRGATATSGIRAQNAMLLQYFYILIEQGPRFLVTEKQAF